MLRELHIRDFALIEQAVVEFEAGTTVLTGETGAGKSIVLDALALALGDRAAASMVRKDARRAEVTARFEIDRLAGVRRWLAANELDDGDECVLRRVVDAGGRSRASINARPVTVQQLAELGRQLVSIHGQHAQQGLVQAPEQRALLDRYAPTPLLEDMRRHYEQWRAADAACRQAQADTDQHQQRHDLLSFQLQEFDELDIGHLAPSAIAEEHRWRANTETLRERGQQALQALDKTASPALAIAVRELESLARMDESLREALDLVESAAIQCSESASQLRHRVSDFEHDEPRLAWLDTKLAALHRLARKHRCELDELPVVEESLRAELDGLNDPDSTLAELEQQREHCHAICVDTATRLGKHRRKAAGRLGRVVSESLQGLDMPGAALTIEIASDPEHIGPVGGDTIGFRVRTHAEGASEPIARIASGGELSRIGLCLQIALLGRQSVPTLLFDEVDAGIGGAVADGVGRRLRQLGEQAQVLCVTHLAQVAAHAHQHLKVDKQPHGKRLDTSVEALDANSVREEIARMLGGRVTARSRQHADELLSHARAGSVGLA